MALRTSLVVLQVLSALVSAHQAPFDTVELHAGSEWTTFSRPIQRVAVIGGGPSGLQAVATLTAQNFTVRLFERDENPGGNWRYSDQTPVRESYPDRPLHLGAYIPDIRPPGTVKWYKDGDDGISLDERWREGARPSLIWNTLHTNSPQVITSLPDISYPADTPWRLSAHQIQKHVRAFASYHGINANDDTSGVTSYSTRVEYAHKEGDIWTLHLRKLERFPESKRIRATWWTEEFDAVIVAVGWDTVHVPDIKGLAENWSKVKENGKHSVWHSQSYRRPEPYANKTILIVGASVSAVEISRDIGPTVKKLYVSIRDHEREGIRLGMFRRLWPGAEVIPEIEELQPLNSLTGGIQTGNILLKNGSSVAGIDEIILATGIKHSLPFLRDYIGNGTAPEDRLATTTTPTTTTTTKQWLPVISDDIRGWQALHWTGHYIQDPTLAFANVRTWTTGRYQILGFAKVWKGTARLPSEKRMFELYKGPGKEFFGDGFYGSPSQENRARYFIAWLNSESLKYGGRFVDNLPNHLQNREIYIHYTDAAYGLVPGGGFDRATLDKFTQIENSPASEWDGKVPDFDWDNVLDELPW